MERKVRLTVVVAVAFAATVTTASRAGAVAGFGDVAGDRFFSVPVQWMVDEDVTTGVKPGCFSPEEPVTRGQMAVLMWRMEGAPSGSSPHPFGDVTAAWQQDAISWLYAEGVTTGTSSVTYSPDDHLSRGQLAALLHRLAGTPPAPPPGQFVDVVKPWQETPVGWMLANGITTGTSANTYSPEEAVTRGQAAAFLYRYKGSPTVDLDPVTPHCSLAAPPVLAEYDIGLGTPSAIATGSVWVGSGNRGEVIELDEETGAVAAVHPSCAPGFRNGLWAITTGFGSVWFAPFRRIAPASIVCELDMSTGELTSHILPFGNASHLFAGQDFLWYTVAIPTTVGRLDPSTGDVVEFAPPGLVMASGVTLGFGSLWVADWSGGAVFRLDPDDGTVIDVWDGLANPLSITTDTESVWFTDYGDHSLGRIDPASGELTLHRGMTGSHPTGIVAGPPSLAGIWFPQTGPPGVPGSGDLIGRYNPTTGELVEYRTPTPASGPTGIAAGTDTIWVAESATGKVLRISN